MAVVAIVAAAWPPRGERDDERMWPSGVYMATPVLTGGKWRWLVALKREGQTVKRRTVERLGPAYYDTDQPYNPS